MTLNLKERTGDFRRLSPGAVKEYADNKNRLLDLVNRAMGSRPDIRSLIGKTPIRMMYDNHHHHVLFMNTVFELGSYQLIGAVIPWVYDAYHNQGYSYDYFLIALEEWKKAVQETMAPENTAEVLAVYDRMIALHDSFISAGRQVQGRFKPPAPVWTPVYERFLTALLEGDYKTCVRIALADTVDTAQKIQFFMNVIQPALYRIGDMWALGAISVAKEHLCSAIVARVMSAMSDDRMATPAPARAEKALVTSAPNEFHEIGAWMVADCLESDGWDVNYLGANTPMEALMEMLVEDVPDILAISVSMVFNLEMTRRIIRAVRSEPSLSETRIMVGGQAFLGIPELWESIGADGYAADCLEAVKLAADWSAAGTRKVSRGSGE